MFREPDPAPRVNRFTGWPGLPAKLYVLKVGIGSVCLCQDVNSRGLKFRSKLDTVVGINDLLIDYKAVSIIGIECLVEHGEAIC